MREVAGIRALARGFIDEAQADLDQPLNNRLHLFGSRLDKPGAPRLSATLSKRRF
jgi:hypothetical protein